jgi:hypothetical protein
MLAHNGLVGGSSSPGSTILRFGLCVFKALTRKLSNRTPRLDKRCSPSTLDKLLHCRTGETFAICRLGVALHFANAGVSGDRSDLMHTAS